MKAVSLSVCVVLMSVSAGDDLRALIAEALAQPVLFEFQDRTLT